MIAFIKPPPVDAPPCECCQADQPDDWREVLKHFRKYQKLAMRPVPKKRWPHVVTALLCVVLAIVCFLAGQSCLPSLWAWVCFTGMFSALTTAGMVIAWAIRGE